MIIGINNTTINNEDLIAKIIQYLICLNNDSLAKHQRKFYDFILTPNMNIIQSKWEIHKFEDALKDIVCILTGCTREQLEDNDFKNTKLNEEWNKLDKIALLAYDKNNPLCNEKDYLINKITYRDLLRYLGTDLLRNQLHEDVWVNSLFSKYKSNMVGKHTPKYPEYPNWIITDVRFENEANAIKDRGGILIKINRNQLCECGRYLHEHTQFENYSFVEDIESSNYFETALNNYDFDYVIDNNGTIDKLIIQVKEILIKEKIL